jgi:hypothetical protein
MRSTIAAEDKVMRKLLPLVMITILVAVSAAQVVAVDETYSGSLMCAMCTLKKADAHECQDVLVVTEPNGGKTEYYIAKNDVAAKAGEACTAEIKATVTGTVSEKDGKKWLTASKIEKQ